MTHTLKEENGTSFRPHQLPSKSYNAEFEKAFAVKDDLLAWRGGNNDQNTVKTFLTGVHRILELANGRPVTTLEVIQGLKHSKLEVETILSLWNTYKDIQIRFNRMIVIPALVMDSEQYQMTVPV